VDVPVSLFQEPQHAEVIRKIVRVLQCALQFAIFLKNEERGIADSLRHRILEMRDEQQDMFEELIELREAVASKLGAASHRRRTKEASPLSFECPLCRNVYPTLGPLQSHMTKRHRFPPGMLPPDAVAKSQPWIMQSAELESSRLTSAHVMAIRDAVTSVRHSVDELATTVKVDREVQKRYEKLRQEDVLNSPPQLATKGDSEMLAVLKSHQTRIDFLEQLLQEMRSTGSQDRPLTHPALHVSNVRPRTPPSPTSGVSRPVPTKSKGFHAKLLRSPVVMPSSLDEHPTENISLFTSIRHRGVPKPAQDRPPVHDLSAQLKTPNSKAMKTDPSDPSIAMSNDAVLSESTAQHLVSATSQEVSELRPSRDSISAVHHDLTVASQSVVSSLTKEQSSKSVGEDTSTSSPASSTTTTSGGTARLTRTSSAPVVEHAEIAATPQQSVAAAHSAPATPQDQQRRTKKGFFASLFSRSQK
jgi:DNA-binding transcriptional regulator YhcF (GntR family)